MKRLVLIRHGKAESLIGEDFDRHLSQRGCEQIRSVSAQLLKRRITPERIFTSPAKRAQGTADIIRESFMEQGISVELRSAPSIYQANPSDLIELIGGVPSEIDTLVLVGHNPTFEHLAGWFAGKTISMGTGNCAIVSLEIDKWSLIETARQTGSRVELLHGGNNR